MRPLAISTVLVATDLLASSDSAIDSGHRLAAAAGAALHVAYVDEATPSVEQAATLRRQSVEPVSVALQRAGAPLGTTTVHVLAGRPADAIRSLATRIEADVIVVGPHRARTAIPGQPLGGTARDIVAGASAPCLVATHPLHLPLERVLVPIDLSSTARGASLVGLSWASALRAGGADGARTTLDLLHVLAEDDDEARSAASFDRELESVRRSAGSWAGVEIEGIMTRGESGPAKAITGCARDRRSDLVVIGARGLGLDEVERIGSVSAAVVELAQTVVLLVPPAVWRAHAEQP